MIIRAMAWCAVCAALHCQASAQAQADEPLLASYFEIATDLVLNSHARDALEISPDQEEGLRKMLKDPSILQKVSAERRVIQRQRADGDWETAQRMAQSRVDYWVQSELAKDLSPQQLQIAKPMYAGAACWYIRAAVF